MAKEALKIMVGCDPELFLFNADGTPKSAHDMIPGDKKNPHKVPAGAIQVDGVAAEFNIDPAGDVGTFVNNIHTVMTNLRGRIGPFKIGIKPTAVFTDRDWQNIPPAQKVLGCDPDFNAYTMDMNPVPDPHGKPMRTAAGHVHVGFTPKKVLPTDPDHFMDCCVLVKNLDYTLGLMSLLWDNDNERRTLYGKAGAFRPKPYGVEYRTLSNMWLANDELMSFVYQTTVFTARSLMNGRLEDLSDTYGDFAQKAINAGDDKWFKTPTGSKIWSLLYGSIRIPAELLDVMTSSKKKVVKTTFEPMRWVNPFANEVRPVAAGAPLPAPAPRPENEAAILRRELDDLARVGQRADFAIRDEIVEEGF